MFMISEGPIRYEEETENSIIKASVVLHKLIRIWKGLFREVGKPLAANQPACPS
jgi:NAD-dependent oxidoreductase involved in siderophore biosynthesis